MNCFFSCFLFKNLKNEWYSGPVLSPDISVSPWGLWQTRQQLLCLFTLQELPSSTCINKVPFSPVSQVREAWLPPVLLCPAVWEQLLIPSRAWAESLGCSSAAKLWEEPGQPKPCTVRGASERRETPRVTPWWKAKLQCEVRQDLPVCCCQGRQGHGAAAMNRQRVWVSGCCWERWEGCGMNPSNGIGWQCSETACSAGTLPCGLHGECLKPYRIVSLRRWKWWCESDLSSAHSLPVTGVESSVSVNMGKVSNS